MVETLSRVLLFTRQALVREGLRHVLPEGYQIIGTPETVDALIQQAGELQPDVLILDGAFPGALMPTGSMDALTVRLSEAVPAARFIVLNGVQTPDHAVDPLAKMLRLDSRRADTQILVALGVAQNVVTLTQRQTQILRCVADGQPNKVIAATLGVSIKTVEFHRSRITHKLGLKSVAQLARFAASHGIVQPL